MRPIARVTTFLVVLCMPMIASAKWTFDKITNLDSRIQWCWFNPQIYTTECSDNWRAGSGQPGHTDGCEVNKGWLPTGDYDLWGHWDGYDGVIKGRVFYVQDKVCWNGSATRRELFIHTEETASNGQYCPTSGDDPYCWEDVNDYASEGCIKVAHPNNGFNNVIGANHNWFHKQFGCHGSCTYSNQLTVTN